MKGDNNPPFKRSYRRYNINYADVEEVLHAICKKHCELFSSRRMKGLMTVSPQKASYIYQLLYSVGAIDVVDTMYNSQGGATKRIFRRLIKGEDEIPKVIKDIKIWNGMQSK